MGRKGSELCASEKEGILSLSKANIKLKEISEITGRPISTIYSFFKATGKTWNYRKQESKWQAA